MAEKKTKKNDAGANTPEAIAKRKQREAKRIEKDIKDREVNLFYNHNYPHDAPQNNWESLQEREKIFNTKTFELVFQISEQNKDSIIAESFSTGYIKREAAKIWLAHLLEKIKYAEEEDNITTDLKVAYYYYGNDDKLRYRCANILIEGVASKVEKISKISVKILEERILSGNFGSTFWIKALYRDNVYPDGFWKLLVSYHIFAKANGSFGIISNEICKYVKRNPGIVKTWKSIGLDPLQIYKL